MQPRHTFGEWFMMIVSMIFIISLLLRIGNM